MRSADKGRAVNLSTSSDPYPPIERETMLTRRTIMLLIENSVKILITTKSDILLRDIDLLSKSSSAVMLTITTLSDELSKIIEPGAPPASARLRALKMLADHGIPIGVRVDPIIPFVNDDREDLGRLVEEVVSLGASHIVCSTFKARWDSLRRIERNLGGIGRRIVELYRLTGVKMGGYIYLPEDFRRSILEPVCSKARELGVTYAVCREGLFHEKYFNSPSCDGQHLIR